MTQLIGFAGKKMSGKNTAVNFIVGLHMMSLGMCRETWGITETGELRISDMFGDTSFAGIFDINRRNPEMKQFLAQHLDPYVKVYAFADPLKELCQDILGLTYEQCCGTDEQKNSLTDLKWEDMPDHSGQQTGIMTGREVLQYVGTNIFRKMSYNVWVDTTINRILRDSPALALITDVRFPNEVEGVQRLNGKVIKLTRNPNGDKDQHLSELALDTFEGFDAVLDNSAMSIADQNKEIYTLLKKWSCIPTEIEELK